MFSLSHISIPTVLISFVALLFSLSVHEASHATAAYLLDDDTAARMGRMTINPLAHIDPIGTVVFPLLGLLFGGFFIGWAKPVLFNPARLTRRLQMKVSAALIALAGPLSNILMSILFMAALSASQGKTGLGDFYRRLLSHGKTKMVAMVAVMRKIIVIANAKLRDSEQIQLS